MGWKSGRFSGDDDQGSWDDEHNEYGEYDEYDGAMVARDDAWGGVASASDALTETVIVPGSGNSMGEPFLQRRERPLTLRITVLAVMTCILITGIFAATPLDTNAGSNDNAFQALASTMVWSNQPRYFLHTVLPGETIDSIARKYHVQIGGIYELNHLYAGEEFAVGRPYKIPLDPNYGKDYRPLDITTIGATDYGHTRFGPNWWNSIAGQGIPSDAPCGPDGGTDPLGFRLTSPNWGSVWIRGFIVYGTWVYHTGADLAAARGNPIHAAQQGQVIWAGYDGTNGLGWSVKIDHCHHVSTVYGHMDKLLVKVGQYVTQGEVIGLEGNTGDSQGPHLHFMVEWNNLWVDPLPFFASKYTITHYVAS